MLTRCLFSGNSAQIGGGLYNHAGTGRATASPSLIGCRFERNSAYHGGALYSSMGLSLAVAAPWLRNCMFAGNSAESDGGAMYFSRNRALYGIMPKLTNCTVVENTAQTGGGIFSTDGTDLTLTGSILWGNTGSTGDTETSQVRNDDAELIVSYSCIQGWTGVLGGYGNHGLQPLFVDPLGPDGIAGTEDDDLRLLPDSPCVNTGDPGFVPAEGETDLDSNPRLQGCRVDLGAYETDTEQLFGDFSGDDCVDLRDIADFQNCFQASSRNPDWLQTCLCVFDFNEDSTVDASDYPGFWTEFTAKR